MKTILTLIFLSVISWQLKAQDHNSTAAAFFKSYSFETEGNYVSAAKELESLTTKTYETNYRLGYLYYMQMNYVQSVATYKKALALQKNSIEARLALVKSLNATENYDEVLKIYQEILVIDPNHSSTNYWIGFAYFYRKDYAKAAEHLDKVLRLYPFDYDSNLLMAQTMLARGKLVEAKQYYQKVHLYNPSNDEIKAIIEKL
jgi:tetratricopeptide (TPR) repeat protein